MVAPLVFVGLCLLAIVAFAAGKERCAAALRVLGHAVRIALVVAVVLAASALILYGIVRGVRLAWGSP